VLILLIYKELVDGQSHVQQIRIASNVGATTSDRNMSNMEPQVAISSSSLSQPVTHISNLSIDFG